MSYLPNYNPNCNNSLEWAEDIEKQVEDEILKISLNLSSHKPKERESCLDILSKQLQKEKTKLKRLYTLYAEGNDTVLEMIKETESGIDELKLKIQNEMKSPELTIQRSMMEYKALGYSDNWINQRLKSIEIRKELTDEWKRCGLEEGAQFATLTDIIYQTWADKTTKEYKRFKGLKKENLRDNMTNKELVLNMLAELSTKEISETNNPESFNEHVDVARA